MISFLSSLAVGIGIAWFTIERLGQKRERNLKAALTFTGLMAIVYLTILVANS